MNQGDMEREAERFGDAIAEYLEPYVGVPKDYKWKMRKGVPKQAQKLGLIAMDNDGGVLATNKLRTDVAKKAQEIHSMPRETRQSKMKELCEFVICKWGALESNKDDTIASYACIYTSTAIKNLSDVRSLAELRAQAKCNFPFKGIASWSKWLNFVWPEWALIYDARIAFALNAIHVIKGVNAGAFPVPAGRDKLLSSLDTQSLAALGYLNRQRKRIPDVPNGEYVDTLADWLKSGTIAEEDVYEFYLMVMARVRDMIGHMRFRAFVDSEMLLFYLSNRELLHDFLSLATPIDDPA